METDSTFSIVLNQERVIPVEGGIDGDLCPTQTWDVRNASNSDPSLNTRGAITCSTIDPQVCERIAPGATVEWNTLYQVGGNQISFDGEVRCTWDKEVFRDEDNFERLTDVMVENGMDTAFAPETGLGVCFKYIHQCPTRKFIRDEEENACSSLTGYLNDTYTKGNHKNFCVSKWNGATSKAVNNFNPDTANNFDAQIKNFCVGGGRVTHLKRHRKDCACFNFGGEDMDPILSTPVQNGDFIGQRLGESTSLGNSYIGSHYPDLFTERGQWYAPCSVSNYLRPKGLDYKTGTRVCNEFNSLIEDLENNNRFSKANITALRERSLCSQSGSPGGSGGKGGPGGKGLRSLNPPSQENRFYKYLPFIVVGGIIFLLAIFAILASGKKKTTATKTKKTPKTKKSSG